MTSALGPDTDLSADVLSYLQAATEKDSLDTIRQRCDRPSRGCSVALCTYGRAASLNRLLDSLALQRRQADQLVIVDASPGDETEQSLRARQDLETLARSVLYFRVTGQLKGLTRQRNFALRWISSDLVVFFDDDVVLLPNTLEELERVHRTLGNQVVGVAARLENQAIKPTALARLSCRLRMISTLQPGSYCRSGMIVPWEFLDRTCGFVEGEWLYGGATMWKTRDARRIGFAEDFNGYALGEDLDFSLRARHLGKIGVAADAAVLHLHAPASRPDPFTLGYMEIFNRYVIQRRALPDRSRADIAWFAYAWTLDTLMLVRDLRFRSQRTSVLRRICGRLKGAYDTSRSTYPTGPPVMKTASSLQR